LRFLAHAYPRLQKVTLVQADELHRRVLDMAAEYRGPGAGSRLLESAQFLQILILLARNVLFSRAAQTGRTRSTRQRDTIMVRQVAQYLDEHYGERIDTEGLFRNYFLHPNYCRNIFKALSGMSVSRYLLRRRMGEARRLVQETDMPLKAVADTVGMGDYAYFMRAFKRTHGVPPGRLRATPNGRKAS
jgi:AraC-like DNA-binding protein